jgi:hypothetical protein
MLEVGDKVEITYAAVAAKISTRRAPVANTKTKEKDSVKAQTIASLAAMLFAQLKIMIELNGARDDITVTKAIITRWTRTLE